MWSLSAAEEEGGGFGSEADMEVVLDFRGRQMSEPRSAGEEAVGVDDGGSEDNIGKGQGRGAPLLTMSTLYTGHLHLAVGKPNAWTSRRHKISVSRSSIYAVDIVGTRLHFQ